MDARAAVQKVAEETQGVFSEVKIGGAKLV